MADITITKGWQDGQVLTEAQLDKFIDDGETFLNTTKLSLDNIDFDDVISSMTSDQASGFVTASGYGDVLTSEQGASDSSIASGGFGASDMTITTDSAGSWLCMMYCTLKFTTTANTMDLNVSVDFRLRNTTTSTTILDTQTVGLRLNGSSPTVDESAIYLPCSLICFTTTAGAETIRPEFQDSSSSTATVAVHGASGRFIMIKLED